MMLRTVTVLPLIVLLVGLPACYGLRQETKQLAAVSYLVFSGKTAGCTATLVQGGTTIWPGTKVSGTTRYAVKPGVYTLTVERKGKTVVRRRIYLEDQEDFEVRVP